MQLDEKEIQKLRDVSIFTLLGMPNRGRQVKINCPFHNDSNPSCVIYPEGGYHCFACGKHGNNAIDFVIDLGTDFKEAIEELSKYI